MQPKQESRILSVFLLCLLFLMVNGCGSNDSVEDERVKLDPELEARIESLIVQLADEDEFIASSAADKLAKIGKPAVPALIRALKLPDKGKRHFYATQTLKSIGKDAVPPLMEALEGTIKRLQNPDTRVEEDRVFREKLVQTISAIGKPAVPVLVDMLEGYKDYECGSMVHKISDEKALAETARVILANIGEPALSSELQKKMEHESCGVRLISIAVLGDIVGHIESPAKKHDLAGEYVPILTRRLKDKEWVVRSVAAATLYDFGPDAKEAVPALIVGLGDENAEVRKWCCRALGNMGRAAESAVPALITLLDDEFDYIRRIAADALLQIGTPEAIKAVEDWRKKN